MTLSTVLDSEEQIALLHPTARLERKGVEFCWAEPIVEGFLCRDGKMTKVIYYALAKRYVAGVGFVDGAGRLIKRVTYFPDGTPDAITY